MRRFYAPAENFHDDSVTLGPDESRHLKQVLRLSIGDRIRIFDGLGGEFLCEVAGTVKKRTTLKLLERVAPAAPESDLELTLAAALLKGDKFEMVLQKAVELGVARFVPLVTERCDVRLKNPAGRMERWRRIVVESSKQCGRARLMEVSEPFGFADLVEAASGGTRILFAERGGGRLGDLEPGKEMTALVGPEGGWEPAELELAERSGVRLVTLRGRILRAETAAVTAAALLQHRFGDLN